MSVSVSLSVPPASQCHAVFEVDDTYSGPSGEALLGWSFNYQAISVPPGMASQATPYIVYSLPFAGFGLFEGPLGTAQSMTQPLFDPGGVMPSGATTRFIVNVIGLDQVLQHIELNLNQPVSE
jgi:hypothetical protein